MMEEKAERNENILEILDKFGAVAKVLRQADKIDEFNMILDLQEKTMALLSENEKIKREIAELKDLSELRKKLVFKSNLYWLSDEGPFCSHCFDEKLKLIRMHKNGFYRCPVCKDVVDDPTSPRDKGPTTIKNVYGW
ncbi:MAG: hypothetical protein GXY34_05275 [Syntrophomonadaceae bacterium]|nr:hypothetical protein [Syntrophomonadaceae bacterium]